MPVVANRIAVIGTGLMGGSVGLACLQSGYCREVFGFDSDNSSSERAQKMGAITYAASSIGDAVSGAGLVIISTPVSEIASTYAQIKSHLADSAVVTDLGSTKTAILEEVSKMGARHFVGGHPMAGSETQGIDAARGDLFTGSAWFLTPMEETEATAYKRVVSMVTKVGARVVSLDAARHDKLVALTSHLPQILASSLMSLAAAEASTPEGLPLVTGGSFADLTRVASSPPNLWTSILEQNRESILRVLNDFRAELSTVEEAISSRNWEALSVTLGAAAQARESIPAKPGVAPDELAELIVEIPDRPGVLAGVTTSLGEAGVNIEEIEINHAPGGTQGTLHLWVGEDSVETALHAIAVKDYIARRVQ